MCSEERPVPGRARTGKAPGRSGRQDGASWGAGAGQSPARAVPADAQSPRGENQVMFFQIHLHGSFEIGKLQLPRMPLII